jgi:hypothetical protein
MSYDFRETPAKYPKNAITPEPAYTNYTKARGFRSPHGDQAEPDRITTGRMASTPTHSHKCKRLLQSCKKFC